MIQNPVAVARSLPGWPTDFLTPREVIAPLCEMGFEAFVRKRRLSHDETRPTHNLPEDGMIRFDGCSDPAE